MWKSKNWEALRQGVSFSLTLNLLEDGKTFSGGENGASQGKVFWELAS
jgi:hypothetical protein